VVRTTTWELVQAAAGGTVGFTQRKKMMTETVILTPPELVDTHHEAARQFLAQDRVYNTASLAETKRQLPLILRTSAELLPMIALFVEVELDAQTAKVLPDGKRLLGAKLSLKLTAKDETDMADAALSPEAEKWWADAELCEHIVRKAPESAAKARAGHYSTTIMFKEAAGMFKRQVMWKDREPLLKEAIKLLQDIAKVEHKQGLAGVLHGKGSKGEKQYIKLINELVQPTCIQELIIADTIEWNNIKAFCDYNAIIKGYSQLYEGLITER
jgi:hypothetical protein